MDEIVTEEDLAKLLLKGQDYKLQLQEMLKDIKVPARINSSPSVVEAVQALFGNEFISSEGTTYITHDMYLQCMTILRNVGRTTAAEFVGV